MVELDRDHLEPFGWNDDKPAAIPCAYAGADTDSCADTDSSAYADPLSNANSANFWDLHHAGRRTDRGALKSTILLLR